MWSLTNRAETILNEVYQPLPKGYRIAQDDRDSIDKAGGRAATYGEMLFASFEKILHKANLQDDDVFVDMGSGIGKLVLQAALQSPVQKAIGIEASSDRHFTAIEAKSRLVSMLTEEERDVFEKNVRLQLANFLDCDLQEATFVFLCATCFNNTLMNQIAHQLISAPKVRLVVSLAQFFHDFEDSFELVEKWLYPTSWSDGSKVYFYRRR